ncbi:MAG TPA: hypothetical protein VK631_01440 [Solirubrobacteraceae bacterium]|nr:hypothetical protein [Solirubrobacteraceae bacterium]
MPPFKRPASRRDPSDPGEVVEVAPGVLHGFGNAGGEEARMRVEVRPALAMEQMFADVIAMARAGRRRLGSPACTPSSRTSDSRSIWASGSSPPSTT